MKRKDQKFISKYSKDEAFEKAITSLNSSLLVNEELFYQEEALEKFSNIHVLGVPRSGTTLINQYLAMALDVGYINNLIAAFWKAPLHGVHLSKKLLGTDFSSNFDSAFGKTLAIKEPHEFGYFWSEILGFDELKEPTPEQKSKQNLVHLSNTLNNISNAFDKPVIYKSIFLGWSASSLAELMPKTLFIYVKRNWMDNALSLLQIRAKYFQNENTWASFKPNEYEQLKSMTPIEQVVGQVYFLNRSFENEMSKIKEENKIIINYEDFTSKPNELIKAVVSKSKFLDARVFENEIELPSFFEIKNKKIDGDLKEKLTNAYLKFKDND